MPIAQRQTYAAARAYFVSVVEQIRPDQWEQPGLGVWTVRDLVGHTSRGFFNVERDITSPDASENELESAAEYFATAVANPGVHQFVAEAGKAAGAALGDDPLTIIRGLEQRVAALVDATSDDTPITTRFGRLSFDQYLPTKTFELVVHSLDVAAATGLPMTPPPDAFAETLDIVLELAAIRQDLPARVSLLRALTGRAPLPARFSLL